MMTGFLCSGDGAQQLTAFASRLQTVLNRLADQDAVTIAVVNGAALGGGLEVAMACGLRRKVLSWATRGEHRAAARRGEAPSGFPS
jgi:hypothetical protein